MEYTLDDYKMARDAFAGRVKMSKKDGDISDGFRRRDDRIALEAISTMIDTYASLESLLTVGINYQSCPVCGSKAISGRHKFCWNCGRAL
ncbi:hypothetical protein [Eubacterium barkeri]|uniref:Zinc-ribbon domain-containing protein n=1 Tax=Eubacterium barkeri TaxID=1528 RepID=A0A1H3IRI1_EUBBA|nr:hypothetical protein [Eubacterium barkeri]SDY30302.1 hypothetical protein SAMN04488579_12453 [Eubacterium barkeri]